MPCNLFGKSNTKEYTYEFIGWDKSIEQVTGNVTYTAQYSATKNKYKITFQNYDGSVLQQEEVEYGSIPTYNKVTPIKASDETYTYSFDKWHVEIARVEGLVSAEASRADAAEKKALEDAKAYADGLASNYDAAGAAAQALTDAKTYVDEKILNIDCGTY